MAEESAQPPEIETTQPTQKGSSKPTMTVKVYTPFKIFYEGDAYSLSAVNATGPFDILPSHHKFLCMLVPCNVTVKDAQGEKTIKIHRALMHVKSDRVVVFMDV